MFTFPIGIFFPFSSSIMKLAVVKLIASDVDVSITLANYHRTFGKNSIDVELEYNGSEFE